MKTQIIKTVPKPIIEYKIGQSIEFRYEVPLQNIGWTTEITEGVIEKINRVTIDVLDSNGNTWRVNKEDIINK
jgi:hypothetical protein